MSRPAVFLDRDGTIIRDADHLADPGGIEFLPGAVDALRRLRRSGWALVVVTNQSGIARGLFDEEAYRRVADRLNRLLEEEGALVDLTLHCPHHPDFTGPCGCRKPAPGMLLAAAGALNLDLGRSWAIGDKASDVEAGRAAGARPVLVRTGYGRATEAGGALPLGTPVVDGLADAVDLVLGGAGAR